MAASATEAIEARVSLQARLTPTHTCTLDLTFDLTLTPYSP